MPKNISLNAVESSFLLSSSDGILVGNFPLQGQIKSEISTHIIFCNQTGSDNSVILQAEFSNLNSNYIYVLQRTPIQELFLTIDMSQVNSVIEASYDLIQA